MCELGQRLRETREAKGLDVAAAAEALKIRRALLLALEECRFEELPEPALARGYLRRYAQLLGLDPAPLLLLYPSKIPSAPSTTAPPTASPVQVQPPRRGGWGWLLLLVVLVGLGWYGWQTLSRPKAPASVQAPAAPVVPPPPAQISLRVVTQPAGARVYLDGFLLGQAPVETRVEAGERTLRVEAKGFQSYQQVVTLANDRNLSVALKPVPSAPAAPAPNAANPAPAPGSSPAAPSTGLVLRFEGNSWVRVTTPGGTPLFEGQPAKGTQQTYSLPVVVRVGNAQAVRVILNGQDRGLMGQAGQVVTQRFGP